MSTDQTLAATDSVPGSRSGHGIACMGIGMTLFAAQDGLMKFLLGSVPIWGLISVRSAASVLILVPLIMYLRGPHRFLTPFWHLHLARAFLFALGFSLFYTAFPFMTLASATTIFFAGPLILALLAAVFLGEKIRIYRTAALITGFAGVLIIMSPGTDSFQWISILPLLCAATYAVSQIITRRIGEQESSLTMGLYTLSFAGLFIIAGGWVIDALFVLPEEFRHLRWDWSGFNATNAVWLIILGINGMVAYILLSRAYQVADASLIAPFEYAYIPTAALIGFLFWGEVPAPQTFAGMALIISSGVFIGYRELISERRRLEPPPTAEASFVPGSPPPQTQTLEEDTPV